MSETIEATIDGGVAHLRLNRPDAGNAIDLQLAKDLNEITTAWAVDKGIRAVLITGAGKNFCVGGDLNSFRAVGDAVPAHLTDITTYLHAANSRLIRMAAPVIAAVQGSAAGAGMSLAVSSDLVLAAESSRFVMAYTAIGLTPDGSGTWSLPRVVGMRRALELVLTNRKLTAAEAVDEGIATRVVPDDQLVGEALALAQQLAAGPTGAFGAAKRLLWESVGHDLEAQLALETQSLAAAAGSADGREGIAAFLEKRPAQFRGEERW
ncbi:MAG: enoyl-CoA hydratase-related protein [Actinomycetota bacterium]|nr:enoyl-CoA hydratase-related protein [Actinomycetota bacterium]